MKTEKVKYKFRAVLITTIFSLLSIGNYSAQCGGATLLNGTQANQLLSTTCNQSFSGTSDKYRRQATYTPTNTSDPVITVKVVVHVITPVATIPQAYTNNSNSSQYNGMPALQNLFSALQGSGGRYSATRVASYNTPGYSVQNIADSKIQYEVVGYYFYPNDLYYYRTANLQPMSASNLPTVFDYNVMAWINQTYPARIAEGLPILLFQDLQHQSVFSSTILGNIPFVVVAQSPGNSPASEANNNFVTIWELKHELGHALGLLHPYYGGTVAISPGYPSGCGFPGLGSPSPETVIGSGSGRHLNCNSDEYLSDLFPANNPLAYAYADPFPSNCPNPPLNSCNSVYEGNDAANNTSVWTNNVMSDNGLNAEPRWISPLQMGRRLRSMHLKENAYPWNDVASWGNVRAYAKEAVSAHASTWDITANETWEFDIQMYKDIVVKAGNTLTIKCKVAMATDGKIIVEKNAKLIIDGGEVTGWCKKTPLGSNTNYPLWAGIEVAGDPTLNQVINTSTGLCANQGIVQVINTGTVSYAQKGIVTSLTSPTGVWQNNTSGGIVLADNANFLNNIYDVVLYKYQLSNPSSKIVNSNFKTTSVIGSYGNANTQITPKEHLKLYQNWGLNVQGCTFECVPGIYAQANNGAGIYATDSYFTVDQYCATSGCTNGVRTKFANLNVGAWIDNFNPLYSGQIQNCDFNDNVKGVLVENSDYLLLQNNTVNMTNANANIYTGMYFYKSKYYTVKNNTINGTSKQGGGIIAYDSQNGAHQVYRNTFVGLNTAILAVDNNGGYNSRTMGLRMNCNVFNSKSNNNNMYDIALTPSLAAMPVVMADQSDQQINSATNLVRNIYGATPSFSNWWAKTKFYVDGSSTQQINHASTPSGADNPNVGTVLSSPQVIVYPAAISLNYATACLPNPPSSGGDVGFNPQRLANMNSYLTSLSSNNTNNQNGFDIQATVASKLNVFLTDTLPHGQDSVLAILNSNQGAMEDADVQLIFAYIRKADYTMATSKINALPVARADWKALLAKIVEIEQAPMGIYSLLTNSSNTAFLTNYATTEGKDGQVCAQAMLHFVYDTEHQYPATFPPLVDEGSSRMMNLNNSTNEDNSVINNPGISVYPNPAQAGITVVNSSPEEGALKVEVKDLLGKIIYSNFIKKDDKLYVPLTDWSNGVYLLNLIKPNKEITYRSKLIKQD